MKNPIQSNPIQLNSMNVNTLNNIKTYQLNLTKIKHEHICN